LSANIFLALGKSEHKIFMIVFKIPFLVSSLFKDKRFTYIPVEAETLAMFFSFPIYFYSK